MTAKRKKTLTAVGAVVMAAVVGLGGTFAWQSISQQALNVAAAVVNPGGRLHDNFDGSNKDVYVENFTDPADGTPIFARVRLDEYMELGTGAGTDRNLTEGEALTVTGLTVVGGGSKINDKSTWITRKPGGGSAFEQYYSWDMEGGQTVYIPTFNKNKDSLKADINGTYDGKPDTDIPYDDYVTYTEGQEVTADATYDNDNNDIEDGGVRTENETHAAANTINGTVITMEEWATRWAEYQTALEGDPQVDPADYNVKGDFWVWDADGWAYWANPIEPGTATGLLLDGIELIDPPSDSFYYGINVVGQFVTADDIGYLNGTGFYDTTDGKSTIPSDNAETLIELITGANISLTRVQLRGTIYRSGEWVEDTLTMEGYQNTEYDATVLRNEQEVEVQSSDITWTLTGNNSSATNLSPGWSSSSYKLLYISGKETSSTMTVTATYTDESGEQVSDSIVIKVITPDTKVNLTAAPTAYQYGTTNLTASVIQGGTYDTPVENAQVSWSVTGQTSDATKIESTGNSTATLTVGREESIGNKLTVTATYYDASAGKSITQSTTITVLEAWQTQISRITPGDTSTLVTIDGIDWKVMAKEDNKALIWAATSIGPYQYDDSFQQSGTSVWRDADIRVSMQNWLENETAVLKTVAQETEVMTRDSSKEANTNDQDSTEWITTTDKIFLLSEADLFGTYNGHPADQRDYTYNGQQLATTTAQRAYSGNGKFADGAWLRNAYRHALSGGSQASVPSVYDWQYGALLNKYGSGIVIGSSVTYIDCQQYVLPAIWVDFSMD